MSLMATELRTPENAVAIIGMAGRFPGAQMVDEYWANVAAGVRSIRGFSDQELLARGVDPHLLRQPNYIRAGTLIQDVDRFDAAFFGYTPRETELMDPQHRVFLETAWEVLETAGYTSDSFPGSIGVFAGCGKANYALNNLLHRSDVLQSAPSLQVSMNNEVDSLASTASYKLNLRGPSVSLQTFCSTSLVAVHMACQSLLTYDCGMALAGGVVLSVPHGVGYLYEEGGIVSPDGHCRSFDARAQGSVMGDGVGIVVLKRLEDALAEGDRIVAVIRGSAVNNDGVRKVGYTAPGLTGQTAVILSALSNAGVEADTISYLEAHGTATRLGDAVELEAMIRAFRQSTARSGFCALGSVKPNIGHLDRASGVAGLIKTSLALEHGVLPPQVDFERPSAEVDLERSPFYVTTEARPWPSRSAQPRRAGVSSFGLGGTNAHVVLEEAPPRPTSDPAQPFQLLVWSARTASALEALTERLGRFLRDQPRANLADVAWTLAVGRAAFNHRRMLVVRDVADALGQLERHQYQTCEQTGRSGRASVERSGPRGEWLARVGRAWLDGQLVDWAQVFVGEQRRRVVLPTYPFERQRYWIEPPTASPSVSPTTAQAPARRKADIGEWFSITTWDRSPRRAPPTEQLDRQSWIILLDHHGIGPNLAGWLEAHNQRVFRVYAARAYAAIGSGAYAIRPDVRDDYEAVLEDLQREGEHPRRIVHLWTVDDYEQELEQVLARGFYSLLALAQAMGERALDACRIDVLSTAAQQVTGSEALVPAKSTILGPCKVIAQEYAKYAKIVKASGAKVD